MHNRQIGTVLDLSFQDRYILAFESESINFNSHLVLEFEGDIDVSKIISAFKKLISVEPLTWIIPDEKTGRFQQKSYDSILIENQISILSENELENFWDKKFNFSEEIAIRLALVKENDKFLKMIISFHHSIYDGHAQFNFLKDFLDIYNGNNYQPRTLNDVYKFRKYFFKTSPIWLVKLVRDFFRIEKKKNKIKIARLYDQEPISRKVDMELIELDRKIMDSQARNLALSSSAYISLIGARAMHEILLERGESEKPIVLYITKSMRFEFKAIRAYQNLLGFIWMKINRENFSRDDFALKFRDTYKFRSGEGEVKKTLLLTGIIVKLKTFSKLKKILKFKEEKIHDCTLLISSGRTPSEMQFPKEWKITKLYAKGSMHRSPGIGLLVTSFKQKDFICIEYLRDAFKVETIQRFKELLLKELGL
ncbi:MAG: condensation domain-containing protein [Bacteriovorax sp.]|nr:condensation domain-containing protein [Bacteriovorax sp.]